MEDEQEEMIPDQSSSGQLDVVTPKLDDKYFDRKMCYAPPKAIEKSRIELCNTLLSVLESPMSPPVHESGPSLDTPGYPAKAASQVFTLPIMCKIQAPTKTSARRGALLWLYGLRPFGGHNQKEEDRLVNVPHEMNQNR